MRFCYRMVTLLMIAVLLTACSKTTLTGSWRDPEYRGKIHKVYVVGVSKTDIKRYLFEDALSSELQAQGVSAVPSYKDSDMPEDLDEQSIADRIQANNADGVLMAQLLRKNERHTEIRSYSSAPETVTRQVATLEVALYEAKTGKPVWSAKFDVVLDRNIDYLFGDLAKKVVKDLRENNLI